MKVSDLANSFEIACLGNDFPVVGMSTLDEMKHGCVVLFRQFSKKFVKETMEKKIEGEVCFLIEQNYESIIIAEQCLDYFPKISFLLSDKLSLDFIQLLLHFNPYREPPQLKEISNQQAEVFGAWIGPGCVGGENLKIGRGSRLISGVYLGRDVTLGKNVMIHPNVVIHDGSVIGDDSIIHSGTVIGGDGFGYELTDQGYLKIPQIGRVIIGRQVEIGCNCCIDRATISETRIGDRVKIDNLVQIAHNVSIGSDSVIVAQVGISGSSQIGRRVIIAGQSGIADHVTIEDDVRIGGQSAIPPNKVIPAKSSLVGVPAVSIQEFVKMNVALKKLIRK